MISCAPTTARTSVWARITDEIAQPAVSLKRGVGRRIFSLFLLAGVLPVVFTAALAYYEIGRGLEQEVGATLRESAKDYGLDVLTRLQQTAAAADQLATVIENDGSKGIASHAYLLETVAAVWIVDDGFGPTVLFGPEKQVVELADLSTPPSGTPLPSLVTSINSDRGELVFLRSLFAGSQQRVVAIKPAAEFLWGRNEDLPFLTDMCVFTVASGILHCSNPMAPGIHDQLASESGRVSTMPLEWQHDGESSLAFMWQLFLAGEFGSPALDIVASQPASFALRSRADFSYVFIPALALVMVLVGLLSFNVIGKSLGPLQQLTTAARQVASGNLLSRVRIRSNDEFEWLGEAFNTMQHDSAVKYRRSRQCPASTG